MAYDIGTARGVIEMEYNGRGIDQAQTDLAGLETSGKKSGITMEQTGRTAGRAGLVIATGLAAGVAAAANFEHRMSAIAAVSGATGDELDSLRDKALQLGKDTQFSAGESAQAMEELVKAGLSVEDVLNGAADATVALAAAGEVDMVTAATIASNAMNQFGIEAGDMVGVVDSIAGASNSSAIDVNDFGQSLQQVGAVANLAGVDFKDTATAIAILGNAGIKGSDAGTSLKTMFQRLQPVTAKQFDEMSRLGLITFDANKAMTVLAQNGIKGIAKPDAHKAMMQLAADLSGSEVGSAKAAKKFQDLGLQTGALSNAFYDAQGNTKSLADVSGLLAKATEGMNARQKQAALQVLFGSDAIRAAAILTNEGAKGFDKMADSMAKTSAAEVAAKRMDNFKGSLEEMMGSLETLGITVGTVLLPPLRSLVDALTKAFNWFLNLSSGQQKFVVAMLAGIATLLLIVSAVIKVIIIMGKLRAALTLAQIAMIKTWAAALGPIALVIAAVAAIALAIYILWKKSETFRDIVLGVWNAIKAAAMAVAQWFMGTLVPFFQSVWNAISGAVKAAWNMIATVIRVGVAVIVAIVRTVMGVVLGIWRGMWALFGPIVKAVFGLIVAVVRLGWTIIKGLFLLAMGILKAAVSAGFNAIKSVITTVMGVIRAIIGAVWGYIGPYVMGVVNAMKSGISNAWNAIKSATSAIFGALKGIISGAIDDALGVINGLRETITGIFSGAAGWLIDAGANIIQGLIDGIASKIQAVTDIINSVTDKVAKFLPGSPVKEGPLKVLNNGYAGKQIVEMMISGIEDMAAPLASALNSSLAAPEPALAALPAGATARPRARGAGGDRRRERLIDGELRLDRSGRAFIRGVAVDADDDDDDYSDTLGRMN